MGARMGERERRVRSGEGEHERKHDVSRKELRVCIREFAQY